MTSTSPISDDISQCLGIASTIFWVVATVPVIEKIYRTKDVSGISIGLFLFLLIGDISNLVGCILTNNLITQIMLSVLFIIMDGTVFLLCIIYNCNSPEQENEDTSSELSLPAVMIPGLIGMASATGFDYGKPYRDDNLTGMVFGWVSTVIYTISRLSQVIKNCRNIQ